MELAQLWVFFILVLGVVALPGLDMAFVLASSMAGGRRSGWAATAGIVAGGVCHVAMGVLGVMAVLELVPVLFNALLAAGAVYLGWIGLSLLKIRAAIGLVRAPQAPQTLRATFLRGMTTSLLNPKAYVFMVAVFPQFMEPELGHMWVQALVLWAIAAAVQVGVYGGLASGAGRVNRWMVGHPGAQVWLMRGVGALLLGVSAYTLITGWQGQG